MKSFCCVVLLLVLFIGQGAWAQKRVDGKKVIYKKYTEVNFAGETVQGKARLPELFYIFQRKRSGGHDAVHAPKDFRYHNKETMNALTKAVPGG